MKPDFALSLSFDGIRLLRRAAGGWREVGAVDIATADLNGDLAALRETAAQAHDGPIQTKLIIPDDQIKYLTVDTGEIEDAARRAAARAALEGATPYAVDALAFDISADGNTTHIAAVARDTLAEAESFAVEHDFHPLSFVAAPEADGFLGEPFFGQTAHADDILPDDTKVTPDGIRVVVIAHETPPPPENSVEAAPPPVPDPQAATTNTTDTTTAPSQSDAPSDNDNIGQTDAPAKPIVAAADPPKTATETERATDTDLVADADDTASNDEASPLLGFATRRHATGAAPLGGVTRDAPVTRTPPRLSVSEPAKNPTPPTAPPLNPQDAATRSLTADPPVTDVPPPPAAEPPKARFLSRRKPKRVTPAPPPARAARTSATAPPLVAAAAAAPSPTVAEAQRMTVFGARADMQVGGKPRYLGLILTAVLLVFLVGVAAWASVFMDDGLAKLFPKRERTLASTLPADVSETLAEDVGATIDLDPETETGDELIVASLNEGLSDGLTSEDAAVLDALRNPQPDPAERLELDAAALEARYAVTGIWPKAPQIPPPPTGLIVLEDLYVTGIDPVSPALDAIALPGTNDYLTDIALPDVASPPAPGTNFALDDTGRVIPTEEGALSPDGFTVFLGPPPLKPPTASRAEDTPETTPRTDTQRLAGLRPRGRPADLVEQNERATLGGLLRSELALLRPQLRPAAPQETEAPRDVDTPDLAEAEVTASISALATAQSYRPQTRPRNFDRTVARATRAAVAPAAAAPARVAAVAPRTVTPSIPSSASVTREATVRNAINLSRVNLIGVYGTPSNRRALIRLRNGRYQKVKVGDRFDGGRVSAIGDSELRYQKGNRNLVLKMPN